MTHEIHIRGLEDLDRAAAEFLAEAGDRRLVALFGPMGAGKTTFTTALCRQLGVDPGEVSSPTFAIVNEYRTDTGEPVFHFDFYRIGKVAEALDIGFYDYIDSGALCIMEWPENIEEILPEETLKVRIEAGPDGTRTLRWEDAATERLGG